MMLAVTFSVSAQKLKILALTNSTLDANPYEDTVLQKIVAMCDTFVIDSVIAQDAFNAAPWDTETPYADYDLFFILESISSSRCENFGTAGFPLPCVSIEPYAPQRPTWFACPNFNLAAASNDSVQKFVIRDPAHEIFTNIGEAGDEITWTEGFNTGQSGNAQVHVAFLDSLEGGDFDDVYQNATNTSYCVQLTDSGYPNNAYLWAIEGEAGATLENRMVVVANHYNFQEHATDAFYKVVANSCLWAMGIDIVGTKERVSAPSFDMVLAPNPAANGIFNVQFSLKRASSIDIVVYNIAGQEVDRIVRDANAGANTITVKSSKLDAGLYFIALNTKEGKAVNKLIVK